MKTIIRQAYLDKIEKYLGKETIIVLVGQRRVGKSCLMKLLYEEKAAQNNNNVIYIDKEKREFDFIKTYQDLNAYLDKLVKKDKHNYILIDEVQDIREFERSVRSFRTDPDTDVIITGSNAGMLSSELSTLIGGRFKEIYSQPLSYSEFCEFHGLVDSDDTLVRYLQYGGLPGLVQIGLDEENAREYQTDIFNTVLLKDKALLNSTHAAVIASCETLEALISANSIAKYMRSEGQVITPTLITNYLSFLCEAYIVRKINRFDIHGKRIFESNDKYFFADHGMRNAIAGGTREGDIEKVMENMVFQHLLRLGFQVYVGQLQAGEIDFVCTKPDGYRIYIQVSYMIIDEETRKREFGNLQSINDNYPKYVVSMTPMVTKSDYEGIKHLHLRNFLMADRL